MIKTIALSLIGAVAVTTAARVHEQPRPWRAAIALPMHAAIKDMRANEIETLSVVYSPLESTKVTGRLGFGMAYHMALVYTDRAGISYAASSGPSIGTSAQSPANAISAVLYMANDQPSTFGTLAADPHNDTAFVMGSAADVYTKDGSGHIYPTKLVLHGKDLSVQWGSILRTYAIIAGMDLTYSPMSQNSNSLAGAALKRAGVPIDFSSDTLFAPGIFTELPID